jgi:hypothetical protein
MKFPILSTFLILSLSTIPALGKNGDGQKRQNNQAERVGDGIVDGELTQGELNKIQKKQQKIDEYQEKAMADGDLSRKERAKIQNKLNKASKQIHKLKHNDNGKFRANQEENKWENLEQRLGKGVMDGSLTQAEAAEIKKDMQEIQRLRELGRANGKLSPGEAKLLKDLEQKVSQKIHAERHDSEGVQKASKPAY